MNYLAHVLLAGEGEEAQIGGLLGDFVKGDPAGHFPAAMEREIRIHRRLDAYTDAHPAFLDLKHHFPEERRRYAGIVLDVCLDHALARSWERWCDEELTAFTAAFYDALDRHRPLLPERLLSILPALRKHDWLASYHDFANVEVALARMAQKRLKRGEGLEACIADARLAYASILQGFEALFPDLLTFAQAERRAYGPATSAGSRLPR